MSGRRILGAGLVGLVILAAAGPARAQEDRISCEATGKDTSWQLEVTDIPLPVGGYVAGYSGGTVTGFAIPGFPGQPDTTGLPPGTSNGLFAQIPSGRDVILQITTSSPPSGPFTVAFINEAQTGYGPTFSCPFGAGPGPGGDGLSVAVADLNADGTPDLVVSTPGAGILFFADVNAGRSADRAKTPLVAAGKVAVKKAGEVTVALRATAAGKAALAAKGAFTSRVKVTFKGSDGQTSSKTVKVTFTKP